MMRNILLAAAAVGAFAATPALAADNSPYVGVEGGVLFPKTQNVDATVNFTNPANTDLTANDVGRLKYKKPGYDVDLIGGYDFGMFRLEGELGYKRATTKSVTYDSAFINAINAGSGNAYTTSTDFGLNKHTSVYSAMLNGLVDFGGSSGIGAYAGGGAGYANVHQFGDKQGKFAWQLIAGAYAPISPNIEVGLKYRYFRTGKLDLADASAFPAGATTCGALPCSAGVTTFATNDRFSSHSLLASLVYNFAAPAVAAAPPPPPPPPPPPAAPATQTCPDGSVILATDACPVAPPPPPPPPPPATSGERGQ